MIIKHNTHKTLVLNALLCATLTTGAVQAEHVDKASGYLKDSWGNIVRTGTGECIHTGNWKAELATVVGCDGVKLNQTSVFSYGEGAGVDHEIHIPVAVLFEFDSAELTAEGKNTLLYYRDQIKPELADIYGAIIVGHTDNTGSKQYNKVLSMKRAETIHDFLVSLGAPADKMLVDGSGDEHPIASNQDATGQQLNRRVEVSIAGELRADDTMELSGAALFSEQSAELSDANIDRLKAYGDEIKGTLRRISKIEIVGHTDNTLSNEQSNLIAQQRAESVRDLLVEKGLPKEMIKIRIEGSQNPVASNRTAEGRAENRRVDIFLSGRAA